MLLDYQFLRDHLHYNPKTGIWVRLKKHKQPNARVGTRADHPRRQKDGYRDVLFMGRCEFSHRLAWLYMTGKWPRQHIDHVNGNKSDNRWVNLRLCSCSQNAANSKKPKNNTSGFKGAHKSGTKWTSTIMCNGRNYYLGRFNSAIEAHEAYKAKALILFGEFARDA